MANDAPLSEVDTAQFEIMLAHEQADLRGQLSELGFGADGGLNYDANFADSSQVNAERGEAEALAGELRDTLVEVENAIERLHAGTYGRCVRCGSTIPTARLEAMPTAQLCMTCASRP